MGKANIEKEQKDEEVKKKMGEEQVEEDERVKEVG